MCDEDLQKIFKRSKPRKGTSNKGQEYEILLPALFALFFLEDDTIKNFVLRSNVEDFATLDDLVITLYKTDNQEENYAFQLKHKEKQNLLLSPKALESEIKTEFAVSKYCEAYNEIAEKEKYCFIIYTNAYFSSERLYEIDNFEVDCNGTCPGKKYFYQPSSSEDRSNAKIYNLNVNGKTKITTLATEKAYGEFFKKFAIYTCQQNWREVQDTIVENFQRIFHTPDRLAATAYIDIFKYWKLHEYTNIELTKKELQIKILDLILTPNILASSNSSKNFALLEQAFTKFDFVLANGLNDTEVAEIVSPARFDSKEDVIRSAKDLKFLTKNVTMFSNLKQEMDIKQKIGYYQKEKPVVVKMHEGNVKTIVATLPKVKKAGDQLHFIFSGNTRVLKKELSDFTVFESLYDLMTLQEDIYKALVKKMKIFLFGQQYAYVDVFDSEEVAKRVTIKEIFRMLSGDFQLTISPEELPVPYIPRFLSTTVVKIASIDEICNDVLVVNLKGNLKVVDLLKKRLTKTLVTFDDYMKSAPLNCIVYEEQLSFTDFETISKKSPGNVHFFELCGEENLRWISTSGNIKEVNKCEISEETYIDEEAIFKQTQNGINVIVASAGMGKSEILKKFKNSCPSDFLPVLVNLKEHSAFFKNSHSLNDVLEDFLFDASDNFFWLETKKYFAGRKKIMFLLDGLDELPHTDVSAALTTIKGLSDMGFIVWLSSRSYLVEDIESQLNVFPMKIKAFSEKNQLDYVKERLKQNVNVEELVNRVFKNVNIIVENRDILDIPLQLFMITEILKESEEIHDSIFVLTKMFCEFFLGRYRHFLRKNGYSDYKSMKKILNDSVKYRMQQYQIAALKSYFPKRTLELFNLDFDPTFADEIKSEGDFLGIILKINSNTVVYHHNVTVTYLVASFFAENFFKYRQFLENILFKDEHFSLRVLFDLILAEDSPPHVAVIYRNLKTLKKHTSDIHTVDKGGRSPLHLASSNGCTRTIMQNNVRNRDKNIDHFNKLRNDEEESRKIIDFLLDQQLDLLSTDGVFQWNCLDFAEKTLSILPLDVIVERLKSSTIKDKVLDLWFMKEKTFHVLICCAVFSYRHLFEVLFQVTKLQPEQTTHILHNASWFNNWKIVMIMKDNNVDIQTATKYGKTILHQACAMGHLEVVMFLLIKNADVNAVDQSGRTPLHLAAANGHLQTVKTLLKNQARFNCVDKYDRTPLHLAVDNGKEDVVRYLVDDAGAAITRSAWNGLGPLDLAIIQEHVAIVAFFLDKCHTDHDVTKELHLAAKQTKIEILEMVLKKSRSVDVVTSDGRTCLHLAAETGNVGFVEYLLRKKANVDARDGHGTSVLHAAVIMGRLEVVRLLLKNRVKIDVVDNNGSTCLHWAAEFGYLEIVELLVNKEEGMVKERAKNGSTALHWAANNGHDRIVQVLVAKGADVNAVDKEGRSPLCWAALEGHSETVELLLDMGATHVSINGMLALDFAKRKRT